MEGAMTSTLLVGNGPNYFSKGVSWTDVIRATARTAGVQNEVEKLIHEPLPMVYERIAAQYPVQEHQARASLVEQMKELRFNPIHEELMSLNWRTVLTTNYDNCLEAASGTSFRVANLAGETTYSVFRRKCSHSQSIWHIHGDLNGPRTLVLGMDQYAGYLQKLRHYLTSRRGGSPFVYQTKANSIEDARHSWGDLFLRDDVHIVGLQLDYAEIVLWWLLTYKQKLRFGKKLGCGQTTYYYAGDLLEGAKGRLELMKGLGVTIKHIPSPSGRPTRATWDSIIALLKKAQNA
jgi:hypothetical protein